MARSRTSSVVGRGRGRARFALFFAVGVALAGCRHERSICDESPGSGCSACLATCDQELQAGGVDRAEHARCRAACTEGHWRLGLPDGCGVRR